MEKTKWFKKFNKVINNKPRFKPIFEYLYFSRLRGDEQFSITKKKLKFDMINNLHYFDVISHHIDFNKDYCNSIFNECILTARNGRNYWRYRHGHNVYQVKFLIKLNHYSELYNVLYGEKLSKYNCLLIVHNLIKNNKDETIKIRLHQLCQIVVDYYNICL